MPQITVERPLDRTGITMKLLKLPAEESVIRAFEEETGSNAGQVSDKLEFEHAPLGKLIRCTGNLAELNHLAIRLADMTALELRLFEGAAALAHEDAAIPAFVNITYNLHLYELHPGVSNLHELGLAVKDQYYLPHFPPELHPFLKAGEMGADYLRGAACAVNSEGDMVILRDPERVEAVYRGDRLPEPNVLGRDALFRIWVMCNGQQQLIKIPAIDRDVPLSESLDVSCALHMLGAAVLEQCDAEGGASPWLAERLADAADGMFADVALKKAQCLADAVKDIVGTERLARFQAALILERCDDLDLAADIAENLHCYHLDPAKTDAALGKELLEGRYPQYLLKRHLIDAEAYARSVMTGDGDMALATRYGTISKRDDREFTFRHAKSEENGHGMRQ